MDQMTAEEMATLISVGCYSPQAFEQYGIPHTVHGDGSVGFVEFLKSDLVKDREVRGYVSECVLLRRLSKRSFQFDLEFLKKWRPVMREASVRKKCVSKRALRIKRGLVYSFFNIPAPLRFLTVRKRSGNREVIAAEKKVRKIVLSHEHVRQIHGFYLLKEQKFMRFDIAISFDARDFRAVYKEVVADTQKAFPGYELQVVMDTGFAEE